MEEFDNRNDPDQPKHRNDAFGDLQLSPELQRRVAILEQLYNDYENDRGAFPENLSISQLLHIDELISRSVELLIEGHCAAQSTLDSPIAFFSHTFVDHFPDVVSSDFYMPGAIYWTINTKQLIYAYLDYLRDALSDENSLDVAAKGAYPQLIRNLSDGTIPIATEAGFDEPLTLQEISEQLKLRPIPEECLFALLEVERMEGNISTSLPSEEQYRLLHELHTKDSQLDIARQHLALYDRFSLKTPPGISQWASSSLQELYTSLESEYEFEEGSTTALVIDVDDSKLLATAAIQQLTPPNPVESVIDRALQHWRQLEKHQIRSYLEIDAEAPPALIEGAASRLRKTRTVLAAIVEHRDYLERFLKS